MEEEELNQELTLTFEGSDGKRYRAKASEAKELAAAAAAEGVTLKGVMEDEVKNAEPEKWWSWKNLGAGVKGLWDDPTGEHGALAYMGINLASGLGTAVGKVAGGMIKGAGDVGYGLARGVARGVETLMGEDDHTASGILEDAHDTFSDWFTMPDVFEKRGMYEGVEGAQETMGTINNFAEMVFAMKGMGLAARGAGAIAKAGMVGKGATGLAAAKAATQAARIGQATVAAGMGGKTYAEMAADPDGPGGWRQEAAAAAAGGLEALTFGLMAPFKKMNMALPKPFEAMTRMEIAKRFAGECLKSGFMMGLVDAEKKGAEALATVGTEKRWHPETFKQALKSVGSQFIVGMGFHAVGAVGKAGEYLKWRGGEKGEEVALSFQVEQNRKIYAPKLNEQAELALRAREAGAQWLESGIEGTENVKRVLPSGAVEFNDGSVWQMGRDGRATITVSDGTILDARTGAVEGMRANREAAAPEETGSVSGDSIARKRAENAGLFLDLLEQGKLPTVAQPLDGLEITETSYKQGTVLDGEWNQAKAPPVIVWVGNDGTRVLVTGRSRAAAAAAAGAKEIKAVEVREDQGWSREQAESLDAVENMREGRGTREEIARGVELLGIKSEEDCDRYGIVPERPVLDAITVANEGSEALRGAASEGTVGQAWAAECAGRLGKRALGSAAEKAQATALDMIAGKLPPEEATAAMEALAELAARKPDYTEREAAAAIRAARERAVGRVAVDADSEMVEMPDGSIKSVAEAKAEGSAQAQEEAAQAKEEGNAGNRPESAPLQGARDRAAEPEVKKDGTVGCARFPEAKARRVTGEDGRPVVVVEGITGEEMMRPENRDSAVQFITRLKEMAGDADIQFADVSAADAAEALLMAARVKARAEEVRGGGQESPSQQQELVEAGQRLVDGLFGEKSGIRVRTGTPEEAEAALRAAGETKPIKDAEGQVQGYYDRAKGEVVMFEGADAGTLAHEIGWHAVWHWAETNSPELLLKMKRYAARAPLKLKALIKEAYGDFRGEALMDEIGAGRFERVLGERFQRLLAKSPEVRTWWRKVLHALARAWKGLARTVGGNRIDLKKLEKMAPEEAIEKLAEQMLEGRRLGEGRGKAEGNIRPSIGGIYTGTAADYANRSRQGGKDDGPSLKKIGTGEGTQVYGWGLYGSKVRGVGESYATYRDSDHAIIVVDGKEWKPKGNAPIGERTAYEQLDDFSNSPEEIAQYCESMEGAHYKEAAKFIRSHKIEIREPHTHLYEQTFFTDRAPGDESHLLKWYEPVSEENIKRVLDQYAKEHEGADLRADTPSGTITFEDFGDRKMFAEALKENAGALKEDGASLYRYVSGVLGSEQAASEFLARAGIDGVKYPVDSYGSKGVKDGDVAGWNYVSFRDDNIRVDHKWTDGEMRYARKLSGTKSRELAESLETAGASREEIWKATRLWKDKEGKWREGVLPSKLSEEGKEQRYYEVPFEKAVDKIVANKKPVSNEHVYLGTTSKPFEEIGLVKMPVMMGQGHVVSCYFGPGEGVQGDHLHGLKGKLKLLPKALERPMMIIASDSSPSDSLVAIVKMTDAQGSSVIVPVEMNGIGQLEGGRIDAHIARTMFGKRNAWKELVAEALKKERRGEVGVFYIDKNEARSILNHLAREAHGLGRAELQSLRRANSVNVLHSIHDPGSPVKAQSAKISSQTETLQFKEFFGDAKKDPANASKVVDENGEPLVVYRGSPYDPLAQEAGKGVIKPEAYFTADPEYAKRYTGNGGKVGAYYLNIRRPFDIRDPECLKDLQSIYPDHEFVRGKSGALDWGEASIVDGEFLRENFGDKYDGIVYDEGGDPTGSGVKYRGVSYVPLDGGAQVKSATDNIGTFDPGNPDIRYARGGKGRDEVYDDVLRAVRAGGQRVAAGRSERTEAGFDAGANLYLEREGQAGPSQDGSMTLAYSEALRLYRALNASAHMPKVLEKMPHLASRDRKGRLKLNAAAFGIVDRSDMEAVKAGLKKDGMFLHEDAEWRMRNGPEEVRAMKEMSEMALQEQLENLAEARVKGKMSGGGRTAVNILAKEIGRIACELPATAGAPKSLKDLRALGMGIAKELGDPKGELGKEAAEAAKWWREQNPVRRDPTATKSDTVAPSELWAEMFGMFLADPVGLEAHAPKVYERMVETIAGNEKLSEAWNALRRTRDAEGPHEHVMRDIERQWQANEQSAYKELLAELDKPIGNWKKRTRARLLLEMHSTEGPAVMWVTDAVHEKLAELKRLKKAGKIDKDQYDLLAGGAKRELEKLRVALLHKQRGGATGRLYALDFAEHIMDEVAKDGVQLDDLRRYLYAKSVREGMHQKGKAAALGMDQREADKVLTDLEGRLGADGWTRLETAAKRFQALREQHILENEFVLEAFGRDLVGYWRMNASYVRSERTWTAEEVEAYRAAREDWMKRHPGESTVIAEIEALMDMHALKGSGASGSSFMKPLVGSLKAVKDPLAATLENDLRIVEFAQRNHWACSLAEASKTLGLEGFAVMEDRGGGGRLKGSNRYGSVTFLKDGRRMTLVMPKVVADGFEHDAKGVSKVVKINRAISAILTQYSPRFALRNIWRNRASNANNIAWMGEGKFVGAAGLVGLRPIARLATFLMERAAAHLPDRFARNGLMNLLYGDKTNIYYEAEATRIAKLMQDPKLLQQRIAEADRLAAQGKTAQAQRIMEDVEKCRGVMKLPIFAGVRKQIMGESGKTDIDELMRTLGMETNFDGTKLTGMKRVKRWMQRRAETVKRFNDFEEARVKLIALLAAEHEAELARAQGREAPRSADEITYQVATMSGSPRYENRGRAMNYIEFACGPFMNVGMKGAYRTLEAMRYDPKAWWTKAASRIAGRLATSVLWMGGGYVVLAKMLGEEAGDDEEKQKNAGWLMRFGRRMAHGLANCSDYRLRNYDIVPVGMYGKWSTLAISMPRGDEDRLLMPAVDLLAHGLLGSERAQEAGFSLPTDLNYTVSQAVQNTVLNSGLVPDLTRRGLLMSLFQDAIGPLVGWNPYNSFTQRTVYSEADFESRFADPGNMAAKVGKQLWNDLGGQVVMPSTTWDEDEGAYEDQGKWALSTAEDGEEGCMPIGGKTIFHALHSIPFLSAAASGLVTMQNGGNERIARRLEKYRSEENAPMRAMANKVANEVIEAVRKNGQDYDYSEELAARVEALGLPEEDAEIIEGLAFKKVQGIAEKTGGEFDPIGKTLRKMSTDEKMYRRALRQVEAEGWDGDFD